MSLAKAFDKKAPFGEVFGASGVAYDQAGQFYNHEYEPVDLTGIRLQASTLAPPVSAAKVAQPLLVVEKFVPADDDDTLEDERPIDLVAWANGDLGGLLFFVIKAAVKKRYGTAPKNSAEAKAIILGAQ